MNAFETLTLAPIDRRLIDVQMLNQAERDWLNAYHARVRAEVRPHLGEAEQFWLDTATAPIS
jgi:Xaa-Pro aminopeptidase